MIRFQEVFPCEGGVWQLHWWHTQNAGRLPTLFWFGLGVAELLGSIAAAPLTSPSPIRMIASFDILFESFSWQDWNPREHNVSFLSLEDGQRWMESTGVSLWSIESHPRMFQTPQQQRQTIKDSHHSNRDSLMNVADSSASQRGSRWKPLA